MPHYPLICDSSFLAINCAMFSCSSYHFAPSSPAGSVTVPLSLSSLVLIITCCLMSVPKFVPVIMICYRFILHFSSLVTPHQKAYHPCFCHHLSPPQLRVCNTHLHTYVDFYTRAHAQSTIRLDTLPTYVSDVNKTSTCMQLLTNWHQSHMLPFPCMLALLEIWCDDPWSHPIFRSTLYIVSFYARHMASCYRNIYTYIYITPPVQVRYSC